MAVTEEPQGMPPALRVALVAYIKADREADRVEVDIDQGTATLEEYSRAMEYRDECQRTMLEVASLLLARELGDQ